MYALFLPCTYKLALMPGRRLWCPQVDASEWPPRFCKLELLFENGKKLGACGPVGGLLAVDNVHEADCLAEVVQSISCAQGQGRTICSMAIGQSGARRLPSYHIPGLKLLLGCPLRCNYRWLQQHTWEEMSLSM